MWLYGMCYKTTSKRTFFMKIWRSPHAFDFVLKTLHRKVGLVVMIDVDGLAYVGLMVVKEVVI